MSQIVTRSNSVAAPPPDRPSGADAPSTSKGKKNVSNEKESPRRALVSALQNEHHINVQQNTVANQIVQNKNVRNPVNNEPLHTESTLGGQHGRHVDSDGPQDDLSLAGWMQSTPPRIKWAVKIF